MNHYCTYFDSRYLTAGLALRASLARHDPGMTLWVLALDDRAADALGRLALPDVRVVRAAELEAADPELARSRRERSFLEHLFTFSPCLPRHLLRSQPALPAITYVDADLWFLHAAAPMHAEWARASVYITPHDQPAYLREREQRFGRFNVGVVGFRNDENGRACLDWWRERCLEWCFDRVEGKRFADQGYLDDFPVKFGGVRILEHPGINAAPWNLEPGEVTAASGQPYLSGRPVLFYHYQGIREVTAGWFDPGLRNYHVPLTPDIRDLIYLPYLRELAATQARLRAHGILPAIGYQRIPTGLSVSAVWERFRTWRIWFIYRRWRGKMVHCPEPAS